ncbi:MAG: hypothetical protein HY688_02360 [Chloroflexi bacterium]|nr:hypothetical protein [Chloroflexota bacterium]
MTTPAPTTQPCPACGALTYYEGHSELRGTLVPHRFHCHSCGRVYLVRSTSHKQPRFALSPRHEARETIEHPPAEEAMVATATVPEIALPATSEPASVPPPGAPPSQSLPTA